MPPIDFDDQVDVGIGHDRVGVTGEHALGELDVAVRRQVAHGDLGDLEAEAGAALDGVRLRPTSCTNAAPTLPHPSTPIRTVWLSLVTLMEATGSDPVGACPFRHGHRHRHRTSPPQPRLRCDFGWVDPSEMQRKRIGAVEAGSAHDEIVVFADPGDDGVEALTVSTEPSRRTSLRGRRSVGRPWPSSGGHCDPSRRFRPRRRRGPCPWR